MIWLTSHFAHSSSGKSAFPEFFRTGEGGKPLCAMCDEQAYMFRRMRTNGILKPLCPKHLQQGVEWLLDHNREDVSLKDYIPMGDGREEWEVQAVMAS